MDEAKAARLREEMVRRQIEARGVCHPLVLKAMREVPRHRFVPPHLVEAAYDDRPLPIGFGQTISQPYIVARMLELLDPGPDMSVLDVGLGSGYQAAVLASICARVFGIERHCELAGKAHQALVELGFSNVEVGCFDGTLGWPQRAPFQGIVVGAGTPQVPEPLIEQLDEGGRLVLPLGTKVSQTLELLRKQGGSIQRVRDLECRFVQLVGRHGWSEE